MQQENEDYQNEIPLIENGKKESSEVKDTMNMLIFGFFLLLLSVALNYGFKISSLFKEDIAKITDKTAFENDSKKVLEDYYGYLNDLDFKKARFLIRDDDKDKKEPMISRLIRCEKKENTDCKLVLKRTKFRIDFTEIDDHKVTFHVTEIRPSLSDASTLAYRKLFDDFEGVNLWKRSKMIKENMEKETEKMLDNEDIKKVVVEKKIYAEPTDKGAKLVFEAQNLKENKRR